jgi:hypothetical protein
MSDEILKEIAERCSIYPSFKQMKIEATKGGAYCYFQPTAIHYELAHYNSADMMSIELHIEKNDMGKNDYEKGDKKDKIDLLQKLLKYFTDIRIFDKQIMYEPSHFGCGRIYILCDYSMGVEKIFSYVNEFIYQTKSRIDIIASGWEVSK